MNRVCDTEADSDISRSCSFMCSSSILMGVVRWALIIKYA